ncbi:MAG TPA: hypothetical protein PLB12_11945 [Candidatus Goldiibacteriota bacterium]|nr:hypothetical protein [Candidatus Goldiibacteriota bacterium]
MNVSFAYDGYGRRVSMTDSSGTTSYDYDIRNRMTKKTTPIGKITYTHTNGLLTGISSNNVNGVSLTYGYDTQSRLQEVTDNKLNKTTNYDYWANGSLKSCTYPNQIQHNWKYNSRNRLTNLTIKNATTNTVFKSFAYTVGTSGNRTKVVEDTGREINWTYDSLYRLTQENITNEPNDINGVVDYTYDKVGNRQTRTSTLAGVSNQDFAGAYDDNDRLLAADYSYDDNGSTTQKPGGWAYTYDAENKLLTASNATTTISYVYDGDGNRAGVFQRI